MKDGEYKCYECKGEGTIDITYIVDGRKFAKSNFSCASCNGSGIVDWIKHAMKSNKTMKNNKIMNNIELSSLFEYQNSL